jgi:hypothetical protein
MISSSLPSLKKAFEYLETPDLLLMTLCIVDLYRLFVHLSIISPMFTTLIHSRIRSGGEKHDKVAGFYLQRSRDCSDVMPGLGVSVKDLEPANAVLKEQCHSAEIRVSPDT